MLHHIGGRRRPVKDLRTVLLSVVALALVDCRSNIATTEKPNIDEGETRELNSASAPVARRFQKTEITDEELEELLELRDRITDLRIINCQIDERRAEGQRLGFRV